MAAHSSGRNTVPLTVTLPATTPDPATATLDPATARLHPVSAAPRAVPDPERASAEADTVAFVPAPRPSPETAPLVSRRRVDLRPTSALHTEDRRATPSSGPAGDGSGQPEPGPLTGPTTDRRRTPDRRTRLVGLDAARGVALLGMMAVHALFTADDAGNPTWTGLVAEGRAAALFAVLAGLGVAFLTARRRVRPGPAGRAAAASLTVRAVLVGALGLALGYGDPAIAAIILPYYAILFVLAIPLLFLGTRTLLVTGVGLAVAMPVLSHLVRPYLPAPTLENPSFGYLFTDPLGLLTELSLTGHYPALPWTAYVAIGLAVGRMRLASARVSVGLLGVGAAVAVAASVGSRLLLDAGGTAAILADAAASGMDPALLQEILTVGPDGTTPPTTWWWLVLDTAHSTTPLDLLHTTGTALAVLGLMLLLGHVAKPALRWSIAVVQEPLAAAGSMTLTLYTAHVLFINSTLDVYGPTSGYVLQVVAALLFGLAWRATAGRGPLEALVGAAARRVGDRASTQGSRARSRRTPAAHRDDAR